MKLKWQYDTYLDQTPEEQEFQQKLLFFEYVEQVAEYSERDRRYQTLNAMFTSDWEYHEAKENYETCQLFKDTHDRFKKEFLDIE